MTAIVYPDCRSESPEREFILEARSPHNGTINHRDGRPPTEDDFQFKYRQHQREFRYRLVSRSVKTSEGEVTWERWQAKDEDSPHELVVSDGAWSILRTHGFRPELIAVSPEGRDMARVRIVGTSVNLEDADIAEGQLVWVTRRLAHSTAGHYWTGNSWRYFLAHEGRPIFVWRTWSGERLVIDLERGALVAPDQALEQALIEQEKRGAYGLLSALSTRMTEVRAIVERGRSGETGNEDDPEQQRLEEQVKLAKSAIHLAGVHRVTSSVPLLRLWEDLDCLGYSTGTTAFPSHWVQVEHFRPIVHHSLRLLGQEPLGFPAFHFGDMHGKRLPMPERVPDRRERVRQLRPDMSADAVLELLGGPDHVRRRSYKDGRIYRWPEDWDYDFTDGSEWTTLRITWREERKKGVITSISEAPSDWLASTERETDLLAVT